MAATDAAPGRGPLARLLARAAARLLGVFGGVLAASPADAADLPEDQADVMYHSYIGGGVVANGPALLVRKGIADVASLSASYYVDLVSNASIDVVTTASPYRERRTERRVGVDTVYRDAQISATASNSKEPDYTADSASLDVSQDFFGGMSTLNLGYTRGWDTVGKVRDPSFSHPADHWQYRLGITQILTARWLMSANVEAVSDAGYLGSPYRAARVFGAAVPEVDPATRTSRAVAVKALGGIWDQGALRASYRYFWDTWAIRASTLEAGYTQHIGAQWVADGSLRYYTQRKASFYSDDFTSDMTYMSRNRQLGTFHDLGLGASATWTALRVPGRYDVKVSGTAQHLRFHYSDFTDIRTGRPYSFNANVLELNVSATF